MTDLTLVPELPEADETDMMYDLMVFLEEAPKLDLEETAVYVAARQAAALERIAEALELMV